MADRIGKRTIIITSMLLTSLPIFFIGMVGVDVGLIALIVVAGILSGSTYSVIVVKAQNTVPGGMGLATGLTLGFMFSIGSLGAWFSGYLADHFSMALFSRWPACSASLPGWWPSGSSGTKPSMTVE